MSDYEDITDLQTRYAELFDARDAEGFAKLFMSDGVMVPPGSIGKELIGREVLKKVVSKTPPGGEHRPGKSDIKISGDIASSVSTYEAIMPDGTLVTGKYVDEFARIDNGWVFTRREVHVDG